MKRRTLALLTALTLFVAVPVRAQITIDESDIASRFGTTVSHQESVVTQATLDANRATLEALRDLTGDDRTWDFSTITWEDGGSGTTEYITPITGLPGTDDPRVSDADFAIHQVLNRPDGVMQEAWTYHGLSSSEVINYGAFVRAQGLEDISFFDTPVLGIPLPLTSGTAWGPVSSTRLTEVPGIGSVTTTETYTGIVEGWGTLVTPAGTADCLRYDLTIEISFNVGGFPVTTTTHAITFITREGAVSAVIGLDGDRNVLSASSSADDFSGGGGGGAAPTTAPTALAPADGAGNQPTSLDLSWTAVADATSYAVDVATDAAFTSFVDQQTGLGSPSATLGGLADGTTYYWRARGDNDFGAGPWSGTYSFTTAVAAPAAVAPATPDDGATGVETMPTLSWNAADGADTYHLQVATDDAFASLVADLTGLTDTQAAVGPLGNSTQYFWRVRAANAGGDGPWSPTRTFTTAGGVAVEQLDAGLPSSFTLYPNYPNPFNPTTTLRFDLPEAAHATLSVYDLLGRRVSTLVNGTLAAGRYQYAWEAGDLPDGLYLYRLETPRFRATGTMILLK